MTKRRRSSVEPLFLECCRAMKEGDLVYRHSKSDKEYHFQDWVQNRLLNAAIDFRSPGRNVYPDFTAVHYAEGYEVKGLETPGREASYDSNSRIPQGYHNGREIYYVFGRYPARSNELEYPVVDLVLCHGDFLNADRRYIHKNDNFKGFGSYGDVMVRDRKMYVAPTPFALTDGTAGLATLIAPSRHSFTSDLQPVGELIRVEAPEIVTGYYFDLVANQLTEHLRPNADAGKEHRFTAYRPPTMGSSPVSLRPLAKDKP